MNKKHADKWRTELKITKLEVTEQDNAQEVKRSNQSGQ